MEINCPECGTVMNRTRGRGHTKYVCPDCGHEVRKEAGVKKLFSIRLYPFQKHIADKRGGVQMVIDDAIEQAAGDDE